MPAKVILAIAPLALGLLLSSCDNGKNARVQEAARLTGGGDPKAGVVAIRHYGCAGCHTIPGIEGANGVVGPPLEGISQRVFIAGTLPNNAQNLMKWIQQPQHILPRNAMPDMGVNDKDSRDIAAYLYSIR